jgi:5-methylcytosine-specific restriction enzyme subunit McrC
MSDHFDRKRYHSHNLYQIYAYVKNKDVLADGSVSGILLYAKTDEAETPNAEYVMGGSPVSLKTLDLNQDWEHIAGQLDAIAERLLV